MLRESTKRILKQAARKNILIMPQMSNEEYDEIKYLVEDAGGHWSEKHRGFIIHTSPAMFHKRLNEILEKGYINIDRFKAFQIESQFYPTPNWLAKEMVRLCKIKEDDVVLEPSAGSGALVSEISKLTSNIIAVEPIMDYAVHIKDFKKFIGTTIEDAFRTEQVPVFNKAVMNPPFSDARDLKHTLLVYEHMKKGGHLIGLISENALYYDRQITQYFNTFLKQVGGKVIPVKPRAFRKSGTNVDVVIVDIIKR